MSSRCRTGTCVGRPDTSPDAASYPDSAIFLSGLLSMGTRVVAVTLQPYTLRSARIIPQSPPHCDESSVRSSAKGRSNMAGRKLGDVVRELRERRALTQVDLAERAQVGVSYVP